MALRPRKRVGVIGLGIIGSRVSAALRASGHQVFVWNRTPKLEANFLGSPAEVAKICPVIQIFVADGEALIGIIEAFQNELTKDHIVLGHATVSPETAREAAEMVAKTGAQYLDAPFTGSRLAAESRQLVYYIGGRPEALDRARGVLMSSAKQIIRMGEIGQASAVKIATNIVTAATIEGLAEAMALVQKAGIDPKFFAEATASNANYSPLVSIKLPKMIAEEFDPHFSLKNMFKDLHLALRMADQSGVRIPATEVVAETLFEGLKQGWGDMDFSATVKRYLPEAPEEFFPVDVPPPVHPAALALEEPEVRIQPPADVKIEPPAAPVPSTTPEPVKPVATVEQLPLPVDSAVKPEPEAKIESKPESEAPTEPKPEGESVAPVEGGEKPESTDTEERGKKKKRGFRLFGRKKTAAK